MNIEFDPNKNEENIRNHGVNFVDVEPVFFDANSITVEDRDHNEQRFVTLGMDGTGRLLVVCYAYTKDELAIRIISARKAEKHERKQYGG